MKIKSVFFILLGFVVGVGITGQIGGKNVIKYKDMSDKHLELYNLMTRWARAKIKDKKVESFFQELGFQEIAVYGMSYVGETLIEELNDTNIIIRYYIDQNPNAICDSIPRYDINDELPKVDAIVVTPISYFKSIKEMLSNKVDCPILSIEDIIFKI